MYSKTEIATLDNNDPLSHCRDLFHFPGTLDHPQIYMCANSLGLQLKSIPAAMQVELERWQKHGKQGWWEGDPSWFTTHEYLSRAMARIVGANAAEVVAMNTLTINIHLLLSSFYKPQGKKTKVLMERGAFSSDHHAIKSQLKFNNLDPDLHAIYIECDTDSNLISEKNIVQLIKDHHDEIALVFLGGVNYYTGQVLDMSLIAKTCQEYELPLGLDLAHAVGNINLELNKWGVDFAAWCTYKYLNSGPGGPGGIFVHEKHHDNIKPALTGWWGHEEATRFEMKADYIPAKGAAGWQVSTPQILNYIGLRENLKLLDQLNLDDIFNKRIKFNEVMDEMISSLQNKGKSIKLITPKESNARGAQCSITVGQDAKSVYEKLLAHNVICDWRSPNVIRLTPAPLYNSFSEVYQLYDILDQIIE